MALRVGLRSLVGVVHVKIRLALVSAIAICRAESNLALIGSWRGELDWRSGVFNSGCLVRIVFEMKIGGAKSGHERIG